MANQEHVERLTRDVQEWNQWRQDNPETRPDLEEADLGGANLYKADLREADLRRAYLYKANLTKAYVSKTALYEASLSEADLSRADLSEADLGRADLSEANLSGTSLSGANFERAIFDHTMLVEVNLSEVEGLEAAEHRGPSTININSVVLPHDEATRLHFLRGIGFTETQIEYLPSLLTPRPIQYHSLFLSYSSQDENIVKRLYADLRKHDVPCWFAPHDLRPGTLIVRGIEEAIHVQDKLLLILSGHAVASHWVQHEVEAALYKQVTSRQELLFPIRVDNTILESNESWARRLCKYHIGDFTRWQDETAYQEAFVDLLRHLKVAQPPVR